MTEHQKKTLEEIRQHLLKVRNSSQELIESLSIWVVNDFKFRNARKDKIIVFSLDELRILIKLIYKLFEVHEEV